MEHFKDNGQTLNHFSNYRIVSCPSCKKPIDFFELKIVCTHCGYAKEFKPMNCWYNLAPIHVEVDDYLETDCCGQTLWALNTEHLCFLDEYVSAELRAREPNVNKSLASRLPQWIKSKKNKTEVLKAISRLKKSLSENDYVSRYQKTVANKPNVL